MKIMLVDDDRTMRSILRTLLEIERYEVVAWDGNPESDILAQIGAEMPAIVIVDVHLREINGLDIVRQVRANPNLTTIKIIMTSGMALEDECIAAGANGFILKPYMPDELLELLRKSS